MARYRLSKRADDDILSIAQYSIENFGIDQAQLYWEELERIFTMLADHPMRGRSAVQFAPNLRRWEYQSHIIFYVPQPEGVLIARVLHRRMDVERHPMSDD